MLQCYNKGCGKKFDPSRNVGAACQFHPGNPIFHDALKGWSCCNKKSTDFSEFLSIPGCKKGLHSNEKPVEPPKAVVEAPEPPPPETMCRAPAPPQLTERPPDDEPLTALRVTVAPSVAPAIEKLLAARLAQTAISPHTADTTTVALGTPCKNRGCSKTYDGPDTDMETCEYHSGFPVFHEGLKFWSCCQKRTTDFDAFLEQAGCERGKHMWTAAAQQAAATACRVDWFQTPARVTVTLFAKHALPDQVAVRVNRVKCFANVAFDAGQKRFEREFAFWAAIDPAASVVNVTETKVEIVLKKTQAVGWGKLELPANP